LNTWKRQAGDSPMDLDVLIIAGCSVLYVDSDDSGNAYSHGRRWAELLTSRKGPLVALLGYGAGKEAPPSPRGGKAPADVEVAGDGLEARHAQEVHHLLAAGAALGRDQPGSESVHLAGVEAPRLAGHHAGRERAGHLQHAQLPGAARLALLVRRPRQAIDD